MAKLTKRAKAIAEKIEAGKFYPVVEAVDLLADLPAPKFLESIDVSVNLGVDVRKSDQVVRGSSVLPNGTVGTLGQVLGPRGLMPNPKVGTVTPDVAGAVRNAKAGQVRFRTDKGGIIHCSVGKLGFTGVAIKQNIEALIAELKKLKPSSAKGVYLKRVTISTTMGPGLLVDLSSLDI